MKRTFALTTLLVTALTVASFGFGHGPKGGHMKNMNGDTNTTLEQEAPKGPFSQVAEDLNLTESTQTQITTLEETFKEEMDSFMDELDRSEKRELRECKEASEDTETEVSELCTSFTTMKDSHLEQVTDLLSEDEATAFTEAFEAQQSSRDTKKARRK
ncbi:MAG: Unknown protein [uncultured Sulfurovum sp.]|uniref:Uncharacterized protein n=1 Tax=uncultured Sulfurovum sp. TaxID=269237 RepID=A0A6S6ST76_9BACT|nr:MAG: Unknown protein [uncultured Sulfurovum sp.]